MDLADMAAKQIEEQLYSALAAHNKTQKNSTYNSIGYSTYCQECGDPIPLERHKILPGCATCVDCANILEQASRTWNKDLGTWWV